MKLERKSYETRAEKRKDFAIGVGVFLGLNVVLFLISTAVLAAEVALTINSPSEVADQIYTLVSYFCYPLPFLINIGVLIYFVLTRTWIGIGMLGTFAFLLIAALVLGIIATVVCFAIYGSQL